MEDRTGSTTLATVRPPPATFDLYPGLWGLCDREWANLSMTGMSFPEFPCRCSEISVMPGRFAKPMDGKVQCSTTRSRRYLSHRCRVTVPLEDMYLQGIYHSDNEKLRRLVSENPTLYHDLAGNAFNVDCAAVMLLSLITFFAIIEYEEDK